MCSSHCIPTIKTTPVYDTYWRFAAERQEIFFRRLAGEPAPWTANPVMQRHKFTNSYRASDRVSQFLIRNVIYRDDLPSDAREVVFRVVLFKLFNRIDTWRLLEKEIGPITLPEYKYERYDAVLTAALTAGRRIYSAARPSRHRRDLQEGSDQADVLGQFRANCVLVPAKMGINERRPGTAAQINRQGSFETLWARQSMDAHAG
jgi:hypothetical protein